MSTSYVLFSQNIVTDSPNQTESSSNIEKESLQIETGILEGFPKDAFHFERQLLVPTILFSYGITKRVELRVLSQFKRLKFIIKKQVGLAIWELK